jgi:hypothetical protein
MMVVQPILFLCPGASTKLRLVNRHQSWYRRATAVTYLFRLRQYRQLPAVRALPTLLTVKTNQVRSALIEFRPRQ